ncbi:TAXI family TRAP transporter solute-binding subunit [Glaciimonas sp. Gout2]|uniref:TAXI family TRAP transporter solute-binding subunit n=1 Tax=unclassified Glaciimonas TaxID=2644401 RepID=UPI002B2383F7|nr:MULTISPECIES: TAXI family TRAP transporter solute-binding subunit [unclassified Glaciimonas]MEB0013133.1 TAXI family TRAP transporter solute-binding subunit [Glaciimonas sp. Cout2]MEB0081984.1 TAXI family TRAP transporter solute-binding subunit [Glaciimonas sp. Gout2]
MSRTRPPLHRIQKPLMTSSRLRFIIIGSVVLLAGLVWLAIAIVQPAVQRTIVITTGADGGIYRGFAERYAKILKREGITLDIRSSSGAVENFDRLKNPDSAYEVGLIQSGIGDANRAPNLQTIAAVSYEPIWVFYQASTTIERLSQLQGKRVSIGVPGSGLRIVAADLLKQNGLNKQNTKLQELGSAKAYEALKNGTLDAAFFIGRPDSEMMQRLLKSDLKLMNFVQADALVRQFPSLSKVTFPRASTSLADDLPHTDVTLLAATALLVSKDTLHPALAYLLLDGANEIHGAQDYFTPRGYFPNQNAEDFPISDETKRYFKSGRPFLQRYLPFWLANFIERRFIILLPFMALLFGLLQVIPRIYAATMRKRLVVWYREIKSLEDEIWATKNPTVESVNQWRDEIEEIDANANQISIPQQYFGDVYALKQAISVVRARIMSVATTVRRDPPNPADAVATDQI